ncbi:MAG: phosphotransferase [Candidatus Paceibacterota bacterium]
MSNLTSCSFIRGNSIVNYSKAALRVISKLLNKTTYIKGVIIIMGKSNVYKLPVAPIGVIRIYREVQGSSDAIKNSFFKDIAVNTNMCFGFVGKSMRKQLLCSDAEINDFWNVVVFKSMSMKDSSEYIRPSEIISLEWIKWIPKGNDLPLKNTMEQFCKYKLPKSPQHGDLKPGNAVYDTNKKTIGFIDWELYRKNGSFLLDYVDSIFRKSYDERFITEESLTEWVKFNHCEIESISLAFNVPQQWLKSIFLLDRCQRTMHRLCMNSIFGRIYLKSDFYKDNLLKVKIRYLVAHKFLK